MKAMTVRPRRAKADRRSCKTVLSGAIALLLAGSAFPTFAAFPGPPSAPCEGVGNCHDNGLRYSDGSFVMQEVAENADGSGERADNYLYVTSEGFRVNGIGESAPYTYITGTDEYGNPIVEHYTSWTTAPLILQSGQTLDIGTQVAVNGGPSGGGRITNLADGIDAQDAVNRRQLDSAVANAGGNDPLAVKYTDGNRNVVNVGGRMANVANGQGGNDAVNMNQLWGVQVLAQDGVNRANNAQGTADLAYANSVDGVSRANRAQAKADTAFNDARAAQVRADLGVSNAATAQARADLAVEAVDDLSGVAVRYTDTSKVGVMFGTSETGPVLLSNVADGVEETDGVNVRQLTGAVNAVADDALLFDGTAYNAARGGAATRISGVADGVEDTDATNVRQLRNIEGELGELNAMAVTYSSEAKDTINLAGASGTQIKNVANGEAAGDAVNKGQLDGVSNQVQELDGLAVKYTDASRTAVVLGDAGGGEVRVSNVADGLEAADAVNRRQLDAVATEVGQVGDNALLFDGQAYNATRGGEATRITGVAPAMMGSDAVNFDQVTALTAVFGGGVSWSNGALTNPSYSISGGNYGTVGDALTAVDKKLASLDGRVGGVEASPALQRPVIYDDSSRDAVTLEGVNGTRISNVQAGVTGTDAANVDQVRQGVAESRSYTDKRSQETLRESKAYTDSRIDDMWRGVDDLSAQVERRFDETDKRINRQSAMTSAMVQMATNAAGSRSERGRVGAGLGWSSGERALSIGYSRAIGERASFSIGGALSGGESSAGIGFGIDL